LSHPHLLVLSQLADGELPEAEAGVIAAHVTACPSCGTRLARLARALDATARAARLDPASRAAARTTACPSPSALAGWRDPAAPAAERAVLAPHLESCDGCLDQALAASRLLARLDASPPLPVPAALRARVASRWPEPVPEESALSRLVVRVTRAGAELLESHLLAPLRELAELPLPAPAVRGGAVASAMSFKLHAPEATITTTIEPAGDGVGLTVRIESEDGDALADQRVFLRRHGRSLYSARTGGDGSLRMPGVERGVYEVACPGIATFFRLDLRE
jgi:hypothetical protein